MSGNRFKHYFTIQSMTNPHLPNLMDPQEWSDSQPQEDNSDDDTFLSELDTMIDTAISRSTDSAVAPSQVSIVLDPLATSQGESLHPTCIGARNVRATQAATEGISALMRLCNCSVSEAFYALHVSSGNAFTAKRLLDGKGGNPWTPEEDRLICSRSINSYTILLRHRSAREIQQRMNYYKLVF